MIQGTKITQQTIEQTIATDGHYTVHQLQDITGVSLGTVHKIFKRQLRASKISAYHISLQNSKRTPE